MKMSIRIIIYNKTIIIVPSQAHKGSNNDIKEIKHWLQGCTGHAWEVKCLAPSIILPENRFCFKICYKAHQTKSKN